MGRRKKISTAQPVLLSVADVAIMLGVCRSTVYKYMDSEGLPSMLLCGVRRIHPDSLSTWLRERENVCA